MNYLLDRPHRFHVGQTIRHIDSALIDSKNNIVIANLSVRVVNHVAYPTYTVSILTNGDVDLVEDVLDTQDLQPLEDPFGRIDPPESYEEAIKRLG